MTKTEHGDAAPVTNADEGIYRGRRVARRFVSPDGMIVLVGKTAEDNDLLSVKLGAADDFWFHVAAESGSHVIVRNPDRLARAPRDTVRFAASLAARYSKARNGSRVAVHMARCRDVSKPRGLAAGKVLLEHSSTVHGFPAELD